MDEDERVRRVVHALLLCAVRVARAYRLPLKSTAKLLELGYFRALRREGLTLSDTADLLDVGLRTAKRLSQQLRHNFRDAERGHGLPRRIEYALWAEPMSAARITQTMADVPPAELQATLDELVRNGRLALRPGRTPTYVPAKDRYRLVRDEWLARIDGLENLLRNVSDTVFARFFQGEKRAFARTLSLRVREADLERLQEMYERIVWETLSKLDDAAKADPDAPSVPLDFSILWAPHDFISDHVQGEAE